MNTMEAKVFIENEADINGHGVWHYLIDTPIGRINVVDYEGEGQKIVRTVFAENYAKAQKKFRAACRLALTFAPYKRA